MGSEMCIRDRIDADGNITELAATDTGELCDIEEECPPSPHEAFGGQTLQGPTVYTFPPFSGGFLQSVTITGIAGTSIYTDPFGNVLNVRTGQTHIWQASPDTPASIGTLTIPAGGEADVIWVEPDLTTI